MICVENAFAASGMKVPSETAPLAVVVATEPVVEAASVRLGVVVATETFLIMMVAIFGPWITTSYTVGVREFDCSG